MYFPTTQWSLLAQASLSGETKAREALEELCRRYWSPLHHFIQSRGNSEVEAEDLTQEFVLHLLEHATLKKADRLRGRFRSFLLGALSHFLSDEYDRRHAQKRGGDIVHVSTDEEADLAASVETGAAFFDREWAIAILENALRVVEAEFGAGDKARQFTVLRCFLPGSLEVPTYEHAATELGLSLPALKSELHRLRQRFKAVVREEVTQTVSAPHEVEEEMAHLQQVLMDKGSDLGANGKLSAVDS